MRGTDASRLASRALWRRRIACVTERSVSTSSAADGGAGGGSAVLLHVFSRLNRPGWQAPIAPCWPRSAGPCPGQPGDHCCPAPKRCCGSFRELVRRKWAAFRRRPHRQRPLSGASSTTHLPPGSREPQVRIPSHPGSAPPVVTHACGRRWPHRTRCSGSGVGCTPSATAERRTRQYPAVRLAWRTEDASLPAGPRRWGLPHGPAACVISSSQISATTNARRRLRAPAALPGRLAQRSERDRDSLWERGSWPSPQPRGRCWGAVWLPSGGS
jgi:hypothetical protein